MEQLWQDLRYALRMLRKSPGFTAISVTALALGIGANTAIFTVVNSVLLRPLDYKDPEQLVEVVRHWKDGSESQSLSQTKFIYWRDHNHSFTSMVANDILGGGCNLTGTGQPEHVECVRASAGYFQTYGLGMTAGREFRPDEDRPGGERVLVLSHGLWQRRFGGDATIVGRTIGIGGEPFTVVGVGPKGFRGLPNVDMWTPLRAEFGPTDRSNYLVLTARLKPGATAESAKSDMAGVYQQFLREYPNLKDSDEESVGVVPLHQEIVGNVRTALLILFCAVGFVLLIACANVANLLLSRAAARTKEMAIRAALGAGRGRIIRQMLTESLLLSGAGAALGFILARWAIYGLIAVSPGNLPRIQDIGMDFRVLAFTAAIALLTGVLFGMAPALNLSGSGVSETLKESGRGTSGSVRSQRLRNALVASEVALALVLAVGAGLLIDSFRRLNEVKAGLDPQNVLTFKTSLNAKRYNGSAQVGAFYRQVLQRIEALPGVVAAATATNLPTEMGPDLPFDLEGKQRKGQEPTGGAQFRAVTSGYFKAMSIPLKRGRGFAETDVENSAPVIIINETFAKKYLGKQDPIGERITIGRVMGPPFVDTTRQIVGVVGDVRELGMSRDAPETMFVPAAQTPDAMTMIAMKLIPTSWVVKTTSDPRTQASVIAREVTNIDADQPVSDIKMMGQILGSSTSRERFNMTLLGSMAGLALLLASIGIYGVISYSVSQRAHEMGIRLALGAAKQDVLKLIVGQGLVVATAGVAVGLAFSYGLSRFMASLLYGTKPKDPAIFGGVALLLIAVAALASYVPARRAAKVDPVIALRCE